MHTARKEPNAAHCSDRRPRTRRVHAVVALAIWAATGTSAIAQSSPDESRWLLYWTAARPSQAAQFETHRQTEASAHERDLLTFRTDAFAYAFFTPLQPGEGRETSYSLGPLAPAPPEPMSPASWSGSAKTWLLETRTGSAPALSSDDRPAHIGLWLVEPAAGRQAASLIRDWNDALQAQRPSLSSWTLEVTEGPDRPLWVTVVVGERAAEAGASLSGRLGPVLRAAQPRGAVLRTSLSHRAAAEPSPGLVSPIATVAEPMELLPLIPSPTASVPSGGETEGAETLRAQQPSFGLRIAHAARESVQQGPRYDTGYAVIDYPGGDPGWEVGNSADLVVRSLRAVGIDLQKLVHEDLLRAPRAYRAVGRKLDTNIDHRRLRNLIIFFERHFERLPTGLETEWRAGDIVIWDVHGHARAEHLGIVTDQGGVVPWVVHHFPPEAPFTGAPAEEQVLDFWPRTGHYRVDPDRLGIPRP